MRVKSKLVAALALPFALLLPAACGGGDEGGGTSNSLQLLTIYPAETPKGQWLTQAIADFQKANPGVNVQREDAPSPEESHNRHEQAKLAGNETDVLLTNLFGKPTAWLENGATVDVAQYAKDWGLESQLLPEAIEQWKTPEGRLQGFPYEGFTWPVWYNLDALKKAGVDKVPATTDELIAAAQKLSAAGLQLMATGGKDWSGNKLFSLVMETMTTDEQAIAAYRDGAWDAPEVKAGIDLFTKLRDASVFADKAEGLTVEQQYTSFGGAKSAIMHAGSWAYSQPELEKVISSANIELAGFPLPSGSVRQKPVVFTAYTATGIWITPNGKEKIDLVEKFIKFLYTPEVNGKFIETGNHTAMPVDKLEFDKSKLPKLLVQASEQLAGKSEVVVLSDVHIPAQSQAGFERATSLAYTPGTSADKIIAALKQAWQ